MLTITELERIAKFSYYRMNGELSPREMDELRVMLIKWKKDYDDYQIREEQYLDGQRIVIG